MSGRAFLSLGANLGDRRAALGAARAALIDTPGVRLAACSAVIETAPVDVLEQPPFLNQVLAVDTTLTPRALLEACLGIERQLGRDRTAGPPHGPRTLDVDLLLFEGRTLDEPGLTLPHPRLAARPFFLALCDAAGAPPAWIPQPAFAS
ncbi:MAG: 2-amino-4-hydroxy-6-hydroxymethyldihydropteridine diphosphokinase [Gemmatimonadota bacterium]